MGSEAIGSGGPRLLLIHGIGANRCTWDALRAALRDAHPSLAIDLPGHGLRRGEPFDLGSALEAVEGAVHQAKDPVVLVGWSLGGYVALAYASRRPERIAGIVLIGSSLIPGRAVRALFRTGSLLAPLADLGPVRSLIAAVIRHRYGRRAASTLACGLEPGSGLRALRAIARSDVGRWRDGVRCPALVINGAHDRLFRWKEHDFARRLGAATVLTIRGTGHFAPLTSPEAMAEALADFLEGPARPVARSA
ncbi:MAG: alpha/beta fold hydrolase [Chloroflexota bacterium]|nr:alpha/beta fold hydrolase [Chloroflexota bacterium]